MLPRLEDTDMRRLLTGMLIGAGLMVNSLVRLEHVDPGFVTQHVLAVSIDLNFTRYGNAHSRQPSSSCRGKGKRQERQRKSDHARGLGAAQQAVHGAAGGDDDDCEGGEPMDHDAANRQTEHDVDDMHGQHHGEMDEPLISRFMLGIIIARGGRIFDLGVVGHPAPQ